MNIARIRRGLDSRRPACGNCVVLLLVGLALSGCARSTPPEPPGARRLTVSAAISLEPALDEIQSLFQEQHPELTVRYNFAGSGPLEQQIEQGAPVDVFLSAAAREIDVLEAKGLIERGSRHDLVTNEIVLAVPVGSKRIRDFADLTRPEVKRIAMAEPESVPAGMYAREILDHLGILERVRSKLVFAANVRQALAYIETGNADVALVYETEARLSTRVRIAAVAPPGSHAPIVYPVAIIGNSRHAATSKEFVELLSTPAALKVFEKYGFRPAVR